MNPWLLLGISWAVMAIIMHIFWLIQRRTQHASIVDPGWAVGVGVLAVVFALQADGLWERRMIIAALGGLWGIRLSAYLFTRVFGQPEDGRYLAMKEEWGDKAQSRFWFFFQIQALWAVMFAAPILVAAGNAAPELSSSDFVGIGIGIIAVIGEFIADRQLAVFRANPMNKGEVCQVGLWAWSRHPNYFFEWVYWWSYVALGINAPSAWLTLGAPLVMLIFLLRVTGIPYTELQAIKSRGDKYRAYQKNVSAFIPLPPKKGVNPS
jgi:steroid 5-alpha reductase family enzyme